MPRQNNRRDQQWLSLAKIAERADVHPHTVWAWVDQGTKGADGNNVKLKAFRVGTQWRVTEADLQAFIKACTGEPETTLAGSKG